jgi:AcrR family transcriptional regulator
MVRSKALEPKLGKGDWIRAGLAVLAESGVAAVRVEPLAKRLKITKGSFYWHFKDRNELLVAILAEWVEVDTDSITRRVERIDASPQEKLLRLFELAIADDGLTPELADGSLENAIRAWAKTDSQVATVLAKVDRERLEYTTSLFIDIGFSATEALVRARLAYYSLVGEFTIGATTNRTEWLAEVQLQHAILTAKLPE